MCSLWEDAVKILYLKMFNFNLLCSVEHCLIGKYNKGCLQDCRKTQHAMAAVLQGKYNMGCLQDCEESSTQDVCRMQGKLSMGCLLDCKESTIRDV